MSADEDKVQHDELGKALNMLEIMIGEQRNAGTVHHQKAANANAKNAWVAVQKLTGAGIDNITAFNIVKTHWQSDELAAGRPGTLKLDGVNLANIDGVNLANTYLAGVDFTNTSLQLARLKGADLTGAKYDEKTTFPEDFDPVARGMIKVPVEMPSPQAGGVNSAVPLTAREIVEMVAKR